MDTNFYVNDLTRLGIKPKSTAPEADALTTRPSELLKHSVLFVLLPLCFMKETNDFLLFQAT